jgi:hypothetical protein
MTETEPNIDHSQVVSFVNRDPFEAITIYNLLNNALFFAKYRDMSFRPGLEQRLQQDPQFQLFLREIGTKPDEITPCFIHALWMTLRNALIIRD